MRFAGRTLGKDIAVATGKWVWVRTEVGVDRVARQSQAELREASEALCR